MARNFRDLERRREQPPIHHEFLCTACAHRDHGACELTCSYCTVDCQCVCRRWEIEVEPVEK